MIYFLLVCVIGALTGAFWGLIGALALKWSRKAPKMPTWPITTGVLLGLLFVLARLVFDPV